MLIAIVAFIVIELFVRGIASIDWSFLTTDPAPGTVKEGLQGGILTPVAGTLLLILGGTLLAFPIGIATAIFLAEYREPAWLARVAETSIEVVFGVPSIIFALFGVAIFTNPQLVGLSEEVGSSGKATGRSFLVASAMMAMLALPLIVRSTQEAMNSVSQIQREASYALGKSRFTTIRKIVVPASSAGIATGTILGIGRIAGDTAIVWLLLGGTMEMGSGEDWWRPDRWDETIRSSGSTLTSYTYFASPVSEGNAEGKAFGAAFILILIIIVVNAAVGRFSRRSQRRAG